MFAVLICKCETNADGCIVRGNHFPLHAHYNPRMFFDFLKTARLYNILQNHIGYIYISKNIYSS